MTGRGAGFLGRRSRVGGEGGSRLFRAVAVVALAAGVSASAQDAGRLADAARHHAAGVEHHLRRALDDASREYVRALELDPPREPAPAEMALVRRVAPRVYTVPTEFFRLKDFAAVIHPDRRLIAFHFFWEDDIDFPEDNDPCDHELIWVQYRRIDRPSSASGCTSTAAFWRDLRLRSPTRAATGCGRA